MCRSKKKEINKLLPSESAFGLQRRASVSYASPLRKESSAPRVADAESRIATPLEVFVVAFRQVSRRFAVGFNSKRLLQKASVTLVDVPHVVMATARQASRALAAAGVETFRPQAVDSASRVA
jgi:hypothetical protein